MQQQFDHHILSQHDFALVDPSAVEFLPPGISVAPVVPPEMPSSAHLMPCLLDVKAMDAAAHDALLAALATSFDEGEAPLVPMFLQTGLSAEAFAEHWNRSQLPSPGTNGKVWLRLHDPRVFHQLLRILAPAQIRKLMGPVSGVTYWLGDAWHSMAREDIPDDLHGVRAGAPWPWRRVESIGLINRALQRASVVSSVIIDARSQLAEDLIGIAQERFGLRAQDDLVEFAARGLAHSARFYEHSKIAPVMVSSGDPDDDSMLADRLALIDETVWAQLPAHA